MQPSPPGKRGRDLGSERNFFFPVKGKTKQNKSVALPGQGLVRVLILFLLLSWFYSYFSFWFYSSFCSWLYSYSCFWSCSWSWSWFRSPSYSYSHSFIFVPIFDPSPGPGPGPGPPGRRSPSDGLVRVSESRIDDHAGPPEMAPAAFSPLSTPVPPVPPPPPQMNH